METQELAAYLYKFLPFHVPVESLNEYLVMSRKELSVPPPIDLTDPLLLPVGDKIKVLETCPYYWLLSYWSLREELSRHSYTLLQGRFALNWYLCLLHYYNPSFSRKEKESLREKNSLEKDE